MSEKEHEEKGSGLGFFERLAVKAGISEEVPDTESDPEPAKSTKPIKPASKPVSPIVAAPSGGGSIDAAIRAKLDKDVAIAAAPALTAFEMTMRNLANVIPDESTRIRAALATLPNGQTFDAVITDLDECLAALDKKERENADSFRRAVEQTVGGKETEVNSAQAEIDAKRKQIDDLQKEIARLEAKRDLARSAITTEREKLEAVNRNFTATVEAYRRELTEKKQRIVTNGKGV